MVKTCDVPSPSYTVMGVENAEVASAAAAEFRFRSTVNLLVGVGGFRDPTGTTILLTPPFVSTFPVAGFTIQPCTASPVPVNMLPFLSTEKFPARVNTSLPAEFSATKKPSP